MTSLHKPKQVTVGTIDKNDQWITLLLLCSVLSVAAFTIFQHIRIIIISPSFWMDELYTVVQSSLSISDIVHEMLKHDVHPPFFILTVHFWMNLFDQSESASRFISLIFYSVSFILALRLKSQLDKNVFLLFLLFLLLAFAPLHNAHELRFYSLIFLLSSLFLYADLKDSRRLKLISIFLLAQTHIFGIILAGLAFLTVIFADFRKSRTLNFDIIIVAISIVFWPIIFTVFGNILEVSQNVNWIRSPWIQSFYDFFDATFSPMASLSNWIGKALQTEKLLIAAAMFIIFAAAAGHMATELGSNQRRVALNSLFILSGLVFGTAVLGIVKPISLPRYLIGGVPFASFLIALLLQHWMTKGKGFAIAIVLSIMGFSAVSAAQNHQRLTAGRLAPIEDWRAVAHLAVRSITTPEQLHFYIRESKRTTGVMLSAFADANQFYLPPHLTAKALTKEELESLPAGTVIMMQHIRPARFEGGRCQNEVTDHLASLGITFQATFASQAFQCLNGVVLILDK